jgi:bacterioferritin-associated ferredoxin
MTQEEQNVIACRCEDIPVEEIRAAIREGYTDMQSLKRYVKFGLGPCQGKTCILLAAQILARNGAHARPDYDADNAPAGRPGTAGVLCQGQGGRR